jgi:signal transduction histidine kinase
MGEERGTARAGDDLASLLTVGGRTLQASEVARLSRLSLLELVVPNVAHEMNNALQVVSGLTEMIAARDDLPAAMAEKVARIGAQTARATGMLRDLVAFVRPDGGGPRSVDPAAVVEDALALRRYHLARARVAVHVGATPGGALVYARPDALRHALLNLLVNAEQALADRSGGEIGVEVAATETAVTVSVRDNGPGPGAAPPGSADAQRGPGLGLPVARALVEAEGGTLWIEPLTPGTRAVMRLPRTPARTD